jgi:hypothetical protein
VGGSFPFCLEQREPVALRQVLHDPGHLHGAVLVAPADRRQDLADALLPALVDPDRVERAVDVPGRPSEEKRGEQRFEHAPPGAPFPPQRVVQGLDPPAHRLGRPLQVGHLDEFARGESQHLRQPAADVVGGRRLLPVLDEAEIRRREARGLRHESLGEARLLARRDQQSREILHRCATRILEQATGRGETKLTN